MNLFQRTVLVLAGIFVFAACSFAQTGTTTIILLRHAEKELNVQDPSLSEAGKQRAASLPRVFGKYKPDLFYTTDTRRTRQTLSPWVKSTGKSLRVYDARQQDELAGLLRKESGKTIVVAGHSNTIPQLANLLLGTGTYQDIPDDDFGQVWIITIQNGKASAMITHY